MPSSSRLRRRALAWLGALLMVITIWPQISASMPINSLPLAPTTSSHLAITHLDVTTSTSDNHYQMQTTRATDYRQLLQQHRRHPTAMADKVLARGAAVDRHKSRPSMLPYARVRVETMRGGRDRLLRRTFVVDVATLSLDNSSINSSSVGMQLSAPGGSASNTNNTRTSATRESISNVLISRTAAANTTMINSFLNEPNTSDMITKYNNANTMTTHEAGISLSKSSEVNIELSETSHRCSNVLDDDCINSNSRNSSSSKLEKAFSSTEIRSPANNKNVPANELGASSVHSGDSSSTSSSTDKYLVDYPETSVQKSTATSRSPEYSSLRPASDNVTDVVPMAVVFKQRHGDIYANVSYANNVLLSRTDRSIRSGGGVKGSRRRQTNLERIERSANLSHITGTRNVQLLLKNRLLQLLPDGRVNGTIEDTSDYTILHRTAVDIGQIKIQGVATCLFLCMDFCGNVYGSKEFTHDCIFNESMQDHYNIYSSAHHSTALKTFYLAMNKMGQPRRTHLPANKELGKLATYAKAFPLPVNDTRTEALIARLFGANHVKHGLRQLCDAKKSLAPLTVKRMKPKPQCPAANAPAAGGKNAAGKPNKKGKRGPNAGLSVAGVADKVVRKGGNGGGAGKHHCPPDATNCVAKRRKNGTKTPKHNGKNAGNATVEAGAGKGVHRGGGGGGGKAKNNNKGKGRKGKLLRTTTTTEKLQTSTVVVEEDDETSVTEDMTFSSSTEHHDEDESDESSISPGRDRISFVDDLTEEYFDA